MRIFWEEIKKIWNPVITFILLFLVALYFYMFCTDFINYKDHSLNVHAEMSVFTELRKEYGATLEPEERSDAAKYLDNIYAQMDPFIKNNPIYSKAGIKSGSELWALDKEDKSFEEEEREEAEAYAEYVSSLTSPFFFGEYLEASDYAMWKLQALDILFFPQYDRFESLGSNQDSIPYRYDSSNQKQTERLQRFADEKVYRNVFPDSIFNNTTRYFGSIVVALILSVGVLLLPFLTSDHMNGMFPMQWSSRKGRGVLSVQFIAALVSALVLVTVELAVFLTIFFKSNDLGLFIHQPIFTVMWSSYVPLFDLTYLQFVIVSVISCYLLSMGSACFFLILSRYGADYVSLLLKALPLASIFILTGIGVTVHLFTFHNVWYRFIPLTGIEAYLGFGVLLTGFALCLHVYRKHRLKDLA